MLVAVWSLLSVQRFSNNFPLKFDEFEFLKSKFIRSMYSFSVFSITISIADDSHFVSKKIYINFILSD